ncbi:MAG: bifunctional metallophosphatase/5'-nucleotidase [Tyzzerella sp.]|nr:bifunctional metallophosphatase/5'-nucleotidase [Tyzzerella sp.]
MKKKILISILTIAVLLAGTILCVSATTEKKQVDVMFLHDTHSHLNEFATVEDGKSQILGGFAKIKTLINQQKAKNPDTLLLDAGDFSMGTLIQVVFEEEASELRMLGELGMDATTFGNHEFDYKAKGLANMLNNAVKSGDQLPSMVVCNVDWKAMETAGLTEDQEILRTAFENYGVKEYIMVEKNGVNIAITGVFGKDCLDCVPNCPLIFKDPVEAVKETVEHIQQEERADMIVCVSHGGVWDDEEKSEDEILAKSVPELDLIISGHTHTKLDKPIQHGDTYIVSASEYGKYLGNLSMSQVKEGVWKIDSYHLITVDELIEPDGATQEKISGFMDQVDSKYLQQFGYTREQVLCVNDIEFATSADTGNKHTELNLGSIMADAYTHTVAKFDKVDTRPVDVAVVPSGVIRDTYAKGNITTENVFNSFSLGIGEDGIPGYPLISIYLTGAELKIAAEIDASISDLMTSARLYTDGLYWNYNPNRMILNKVTDVYLCDANEQRVEIEDEKLYRVVTDFYTSQMLGGVTDLSYGLLSIVPKFADGTPVERYEDAVIKADGKELKAWAAIAEYMNSFEDTDNDGIGNVPSKYGQEEGRKVVEDSKNLGDLLKNPNKFFFMILAVVLVVIALLVAIVVLIVKMIKKIRKRCRKTEMKE